tara:strand:- start:9304 stop:10146 length:843 start_codon:yes stop_codon:yes gene_type:complete
MNDNIKELELLFENNKQKITELEKNIYDLELKLFEKLNIRIIQLDKKLKFKVNYFSDNFIINILDLQNQNFDSPSVLDIYVKNNDIQFSFNFSNYSKDDIELYSFILDCIKEYSLEKLDYSYFSNEYKNAIFNLKELKSDNLLLNQKIKNLHVENEIEKINSVLYYIEEEKAIEFYHSLIKDKETKKIKLVHLNILDDVYSFREHEFIINFFSCSKPKIKLIFGQRIDEDEFIDICKKQFYFNNKLVTDLNTVSFLGEKKYASVKQIAETLSPYINANKF